MIVCDRCGIEIGHNVDSWRVFDYSQTVNLCLECQRAFAKWLVAEKKKKGK